MDTCENDIDSDVTAITRYERTVYLESSPTVVFVNSQQQPIYAVSVLPWIIFKFTFFSVNTCHRPASSFVYLLTYLLTDCLTTKFFKSLFYYTYLILTIFGGFCKSSCHFPTSYFYMCTPLRWTKWEITPSPPRTPCGQSQGGFDPGFCSTSSYSGL